MAGMIGPQPHPREAPRHAAARIFALPPTERPAAIFALPAELRDPVRYYLDHYIPDLSARRRVARAAQATVEARKAAAARAGRA